MHVSWLGLTALGLSAISATLILGFLYRAPPLTGAVKLLLLFALLVLPAAAAVLGNASNLETTKSVEFCGQCHVMTSYVNNVHDKTATNLAARHGALPEYGGEACYGCHSDYGMFGGVTTKLGGMRHVWEFYTDDWTRPGHPPPELYKPYDTRRCEQCHAPLRPGAPLEHRVHAAKIQDHSVSCAATGCHGPPHPPWVQQVKK